MHPLARAAAACLFLGIPRAEAADATAAQPADRPMPEYPEAAHNAGGHVTVRFDIGTDGHTRNPLVVRSDPPGVFDQSALTAVARWVYRPAMRDGRPVGQIGNEVNLAFVPPPPEPVFQPTIDYPRAAYAARHEGTVTVAFDITPAGLTTHVRVLKSNPPGIFDKSAVAAVSDWQYAATSPDEPYPPQTVEIPFTLANAQPSPIPLHSIRLVYPSAAMADGVMGNCNVGFWIEENGTTSGAQVLACTPTGYFEAATLAAVKAATYQVEAEPRLNQRRYHRVAVKFRFSGTSSSEISYLKPGQWVKLRFTRTADGHARRIEVVAQSSPDIPTDKAVEQLRETTLAPVIQNGRLVDQPNSTIIISSSRD